MYLEDIQIIRNGLPKTSSPKQITIIGAGISGLVAGSLLKQAGHQITILEGLDRIGGRIFTVRKPFTNGNYFEGGAMRFPSSHIYVFEYTRKFGLPLESFLNNTPHDIYHANGIMTRASFFAKYPDVLQFPVAPSEKGKTVLELIRWCEEPYHWIMKNGTEQQKRAITVKLSQQSFEDFYLNNLFGRSLSYAAMEMIMTIEPIQGMPFVSMLELTNNLYAYFLDRESPWYAIRGGNDQLPRAFYPLLKNELYFNHKVMEITCRKDSISLAYTHLENGNNGSLDSEYLLITVPFVALKNINIYPPTAFSYKKRRAIMTLNYEKAMKIGLEFKSQFWEKDGMIGGKTVTDGPTRYTFYPSNRYNNVVIASYTWGKDIFNWEGLTDSQRTRQCLEFLAKIHGPVVYEEFVTGGAYIGAEESMGGGDFCFFQPHQQLNFGNAIGSPEGRVHFAGEHTSYYHGWVQGGIQSGIRAAREMNNRSFKE